jgi:transposase InsO family protein
LGAKVRSSFLASDRTYGARRVWRDMLAEGVLCGLHRIERLMRLQALKARPRRRRLPPDLGERQVAAVAANVLDRSFEAPAPNRKWIADFTYVWTAEGWLYVAAVIDLFSRRVVGWSMSAEMTAQLVTDALVMAIWRRGKPDALLHHSDRGSQYTSEQFQKLMSDHGVICSMSRSGNVWDNAAMESFFSSLKTERTARKTVQANRRQSGGTNFGEKLKGYVEENIAATHEFIKQLTQAKDFEAVLRNQKEFVRSQFEAFGEQAKTLGETTLDPHSMPVIRAPLDELTDTFRDTILRTRAL